MLPHLLQVKKICILPFDDGGHATEGRTLKLFASVERIAILEKSCVVTSNTAM